MTDNNLIKVTIDTQEIKVKSGTTILEAARMCNVHIPTLCAHDDLCVAGNCRLCVVEVEGERILQASCTYPITRPLVVKSTSPRVRRARRHILDLLLSKHYGECYTCMQNGYCELQDLAAEYGVDSFRFGHLEKPIYEIDNSSLSITRDMNKCILCRRCVRACMEVQGIGTLNVVGRSEMTEIATLMDHPLKDVVCINCGQCVIRCPTAALTERDQTDDIWAAIDDPKKHVVIQTAPSPRAAMGEYFGLEPGVPVTFEMNTAIRMAGFDKVFDTNFTADLTIVEEASELITRLYSIIVKGEKAAIPQFTSCCPGWIRFIEHFYPEYLDNVSSCKSPQQMFGALIKTYYADETGIDPKNIVSISLMPCTAKKFEALRPEMRDSGCRDIDFTVTTRELGKMFKEAGIDLMHIPKSDFDDPFGTATGSGVIFGATGGVMESAIRDLIELVTGKEIEDFYEHADIIPVRGFEGVKYAELTIPEVGEVPDLLKNLVPDWDWLKGVTLKVGITHGAANIRKVMEDIKAGGKFSECHLIEFMACPGGCLGGGGHPIPTSPEIRQSRADAIYAEDSDSETRKSHENPALQKIYKEFLTEGPCSHKSHKLLHTKYTPRGKFLILMY